MKQLITFILSLIFLQACTSSPHFYTKSQAHEPILSEVDLDASSIRQIRTVPKNHAPLSPTTNTTTKRIIIYKADIALSVTRLKHSHDELVKLSKSMGGWMQNQSNNQLTLRIPVNFFESFLMKLDAIGVILHKNIDARDVTEDHHDLVIRLANSEKTLVRLGELYSKTQNITEILKIEKEMTRVTTQIDLYKGKLKYLKNHSSFSTIRIQLNPAVTQSNYTPSFSWLGKIAQDLQEPLLAGAHSKWFSKVKINWPKDFVALSHSRNSASAMSSEGLFSRVYVLDANAEAKLDFWVIQVKQHLQKAKFMSIKNTTSIFFKDGSPAIRIDASQGSLPYSIIICSGDDEVAFLELWGTSEKLQDFNFEIITKNLAFDID